MKKRRPMSAEARKRIGEKLRGRKLTEEHRRKIGVARLGKPLSEAHRESIREGQLRTGMLAMRNQADVYRKNLSPGEQAMARILTEGGVRFKAQVAIWMYIADFLVWPNIVLEVDGSSKGGMAIFTRNFIRDTLLRSLGFIVVRVRETALRGEYTNAG